MTEEQIVMAYRLLAALGAGGLIGFERSFRGRPAGFRTHTLVCLASTVLMLVTVFDWQWVQARTPDTIRSVVSSPSFTVRCRSTGLPTPITDARPAPLRNAAAW